MRKPKLGPPRNKHFAQKSVTPNLTSTALIHVFYGWPPQEGECNGRQTYRPLRQTQRLTLNGGVPTRQTRRGIEPRPYKLKKKRDKQKDKKDSKDNRTKIKQAWASTRARRGPKGPPVNRLIQRRDVGSPQTKARTERNNTNREIKNEQPRNHCVKEPPHHEHPIDEQSNDDGGQTGNDEHETLNVS